MIINSILPEECLLKDIKGDFSDLRHEKYFLEQQKRLGLINSFEKKEKTDELQISTSDAGAVRKENRKSNRKEPVSQEVKISMGDQSYLKKIFNEEGQLLCQEDVQLNDKGNISQIIINDYAAKEETTIICLYNEQGQMQRIEFKNEHGSTFQQAAFKYDKKGRIIEEKGSRHKRKINFDEFHYVTSYKYLNKDKQGNWTRRRLKTEFGFHYQNVVKYTLEERNLTYRQ
ncbi:hypothetical protein [Persicobacter diffluens]|uniref:Uncharacterized protein n=1 Tax=Persicobacter diffluens TaxID=981 RepID=A0AAN4VYE3_9BACT|nr:hypothetical protein PEDI_17850 [Persicobacter diffluens]